MNGPLSIGHNSGSKFDLHLPFTELFLRIQTKGLAELRDFLEGFWDVRLEALKREAEKEERKKHGRRN